MHESDDHDSKLQEVKKHVEPWQKNELKDFNFERLSGLTNEIWKITNKKGNTEPKAVIFRRFGESGEFLNRETENKIFRQLSDEGISPGLYHATEDFRIEEFIDFKELDTSLVNTPKFRLKIALVLQRLHKITVDPIDKAPMFKTFLANQEIAQQFTSTLDDVLAQNPNHSKFAELKSLTTKDELDFLTKSLPQRTESLCFSHNDLHNRNMLYSAKVDKLILIDFEYAGYNYKGYDIANLFNEAIVDYKVTETPYFKIDITKFPTDLELVEFVQYYVVASVLTKHELKSIETLSQENLKEFVREKIEKFKLQEEIKVVLKEVRLCLMYSHYYWSVWSVIKSKGASIKFDYMQFAYDRYCLYRKFKEIYTSNYASCWSVKDYTTE